MDFNQLFTGARDSVMGAVTDFANTGAPVLIAAAEQYGAQTLQGMANSNVSLAQSNVDKLIANKTPPSAFGNVLNNIVGSVTQGTFAKNYGTETLMIVAALLVVGYCLK